MTTSDPTPDNPTKGRTSTALRRVGLLWTVAAAYVVDLGSGAKVLVTTTR
ncbi:hypothetical protein [Streptomyces sp. CB03911]|nr:hypothetical protein [Streptomyces sp. CB03911]